ncbi:MAG: hypothetical protein KGQ95_05150 [Acidobacteria bacterium]|jgi:hypothetical protein|nr:hypothetical protein [Acidobacteriota bacterium]
MGKFKEFVPVVASFVLIALFALIPLGVGLGDDGLSGVRSATAALASTNIEGQSLQATAQQEQVALTESIVAASKGGATPKQIAKAVFQIGAGTLVQAEMDALKGVQTIIAQAKAQAQSPVVPQP